MSIKCPNCGAENPDNAQFCNNCGTALKQIDSTEKKAATEQETESLNSTAYYMDSTHAFYIKEKLEDLRTAFFLLFIGTILSLIPFINIIGGIVDLIGFIMLIIGFTKASKTSLPHRTAYYSTRTWLVIMVVVSVILTITIMFSITVMVQMSVHKNGISLLSVPPVLVMLVISMVVYIISYFKVINALKFLSEDLQVARLASASRFMFYSLITGVIFGIIGIITFGITMSVQFFAIFGMGLYTIALILVPYLFQIIAVHDAYSGLDEFFSRVNAGITTVQQQSTEPPKFSF